MPEDLAEIAVVGTSTLASWRGLRRRGFTSDDESLSSLFIQLAESQFAARISRSEALERKRWRVLWWCGFACSLP